MNLQPDTEIILLHVPLDLSYKNQLSFNSKQDQETYFKSKEKFSFDEVSYQRKDGFMRIDKNYDELYDVNYVMYKNNTMPNKWIYAFVSRMEYASENSTYIYIQTDVFQTWWFDMDFHESFIEREMIDVDDDVPGANLYPENLEIGEVRVQDTQNISDLEPVSVIAFSGEKVMFSQGTGETTINQNGFILNGMPVVCAFLFCEVDAYPILVESINNAGNGDKIISSFTVPKLALKDFFNEDRKIGEVVGTLKTYKIYGFQGSALPTVVNNFKQSIKSVSSFSRPNSIDGYTPVNKKVLTYPYCYIGMNTPNSSKKIFRFEDFSNGTGNFKVICEINPNPTCVFIPQNYRNSEANSMQDLVAINGYPNLANINDYFNTWLAQNSNIVSLQMEQEQFNYQMGQVSNIIGGFTSLVTNGFSGNIGGAVQDLVSTPLNAYTSAVNHDFYIKNQMAQIEKQALLPDTVSLSSSNATILGYDLIDNSIFNLYTIKSQFAKRIDDYFSMYGYATNEVKLPNINTRPNWNYIKTIGANITGEDISQEDIVIIKNIFDNGITIWHDPDTFLDYSQNNR